MNSRMMALAIAAESIWELTHGRVIMSDNQTTFDELVKFPRYGTLEFWSQGVLVAIAGYLIVSITTLPFLFQFWLGEFPPLALIQLPKISFAKWLLSDLVLPLIKHLGFSRGSASPDYVLARPYALMLSYLIPAAMLLVLLLATRQFRGTTRLWYAIVLVAMVADFFFVMKYAAGGRTTMY